MLGAHKVFISYASQDRAVADAVVHALEQAGVPCWMAPRDIPAGADWSSTIPPAIDASTIVVLVLSAHSCGSEQVAREIHLVQPRRKTIIAFHVDAAEPFGPLRYLLSGLHRIEAQNDPHARIGELVESVRRTLAPSAEQSAAAEAMQDTLPEERGTLLGRDTEVGLVRQLVRDNRVVTLTGPGGVGKTRTAIHVARSMLGEFPGGVDFIELAPISAPEIVESAIQTHCGKRAENAFLLIVDNCEHVLQAAARTIQRAVASSKHLYVLCTSRQPLGIGAEHVFRLRPLTAPPRTPRAPTLAELNASPAVRLFLERAAAVAPVSLGSETSRAAVASICRDLDGLPLALQLAATRAGTLSFEQIAAAIGNRFRLLTRGAGDTAAHHQNLRAVIDWSYELLQPAERRLFARLGVFGGRFSLSDVQALCAHELDEFETIDALQTLIEQSLVENAGIAAAQQRYDLLESIRRYARDLLDASGETQQSLGLLSAYVSNAVPLLSAQPNAVKLLDAQIDNLRTAITWSIVERHDVERGARLLADLADFWQNSGRWVEAEHWYRVALGHSNALDDRDLNVRLLIAGATIAFYRANYARAAELLETATLALDASGDTQTRARVLNSLASVKYETQDFGSAQSLWAQTLELLQNAGDEIAAAMVTSNLGMLAWQVHENYRDAEQHYRSALEVFRRRGSPIRAAQALGSLAEIAYATGDLRFAIDLAEQSLRIFEEIGNTSYVADRLTLLAKYRVALNEDELALPLLRDALTAFSDLDQPLEIAECAFVAAEILARRGDFVTAANLYGFAQHVRDSGRPTARADRERAERLQGSLISKLDETQYASLVRTGTLLAHTQAAIMALAAIDEAA